MALHRRTALSAAVGFLAAPYVARAATRRLRLGHNTSVDSVTQATAVGFATALAERSEGRLTVDIVPNGALGNETQMTQAVADGTLDMSVSPVGTTAALVPEVGLVETPFLFRDAAHARAALDGPLGKHCSDLLAAKRLIVIAWGEIGFRHVTANKPVRAPADLAGLKIRVPPGKVIMESFRAMGAAADTLPFQQLPEALRTGRFEAQENPVNIILTGKLNQYQSHLSLTGHVYTPSAIVVSADLLEELSPADQDIIKGAGLPGALASRSMSDAFERTGLATLGAAGMTIVTDVDHAAMRAGAAKAKERLSVAFGADMVNRVATLAG